MSDPTDRQELVDAYEVLHQINRILVELTTLLDHLLLLIQQLKNP